MKESTPKKNSWFSNRILSPMVFLGEKNHGCIPNQSFEYSENWGASERIPELTTDGYLYLILLRTASHRFRPCTLDEGYVLRIRLQISSALFAPVKELWTYLPLKILFL
jgi:hypothetical protein